MKRALIDYVMIACLGASTGSIFISIYFVSEKILKYNHPWHHMWLSAPLSVPFGVLAAMLVRQAIRAQNAVFGLPTFTIVVVSSIIAFVLGAGSADFILTDDNAPDYAATGAVGGLIGAATLAIPLWMVLRRRNIRFVWWPMVIVGALIGVLWSEDPFDLPSSPGSSWLLIPLWQASVSTALWFGLPKVASRRLKT